MDNIAPKLLKAVQTYFQKEFDKSNAIALLYKKVRDGTATYEEANEFAIQTGEILAAAFGATISEDVLPDGRMYYNIAEQVLRPMLENNYDLIADVTKEVQTSLNKAANIGIKAKVAECNHDRINGLVNKVASYEKYSDAAWVLNEPVINFSQSIVDDSVRTNAEYQLELGMRPMITRKVAGDCCDWCRALAGTYAYPEDVPEDLYRRHRYCRCTVIYDPKDGKRKVQDSHSKKWHSDSESAILERRKNVGLKEENPREKEIRKNYGTEKSLFDRKDKLKSGDHDVYEGCRDVLGEWKREANYSVKQVHVLDLYTINGTTYKVDGKHVLSDHTKHEKDIAEMLVREFGGEVLLVPRIVYPQGISTPDYIYRNQSYDLKMPTGKSKNVLYNMVSKKKSQASNFIFDITECPLEKNEIIKQVELLYKSRHTRFIDVIVLVSGENIENVFRRK